LRGNEWYRERRRKLVAEFGGQCWFCGSREDLEFAHIKATGLNGRGRGQNHRVIDVIRNKKSYVLACRRCHVAYDAGDLDVPPRRSP